MSKIVACVNQKGGVGKTTTVCNVGAGLAQLGKKILLIDFDPQEHLTAHVGISLSKQDKTIYEVLKEEVGLNDVIIDRKGFRIIPSSIDMSSVDIELAGVPGREFLLKNALKEVVEFDYILIDCPPSLGLLTLNALSAADEAWIPFQCEYFALRGMKKLLKTVELVKKRINGHLEITGVIGTRYDNRKNLNREVVESIKESFKDKLFKTLIRENISLPEATSFGKTIFEYQSDSHGAEDYLSLSREVIKRG